MQRFPQFLATIPYVDLVIPEESWNQKRSDVKEYHIDTFVMGDDWEGKSDDLKDLCDVVYLPHTPEISTTQIKKELVSFSETEKPEGSLMNDFGYQVEPLKRQLQLCELGILKEVKRVCEKHHITFYLSCGTLLGAVRHQGFIPWDDDIDIEMPYADYQKFLTVAQEELGEDFFVQNRKTDDLFSFAYTKIRKNNTTLLSKYDIGIPGHHGVWIDFFPQTFIGGKFDYLFKKTCVRISNFLVLNDAKIEQDRAWLEKNSSKMMVGFVVAVHRIPFKIRKKLSDFFLKPVFITKRKKRIAKVWNSITYTYCAETFDGGAEFLRFEDELFPVPKQYQQYLIDTYGENYMVPPPMDQRNGGHGDIIIDLENGWEKYNG